MWNYCEKIVAATLLLVACGLTAFAQAPLSDNMPASGVLGQAGFITNTSGNSASAMSNAFGVAIDPTTGKLFVADRNNNRVLRFSAASKMTDGAAAEAVLGQPDDTTITSGLSDVKMNTPVRLFVDGAGRLWVSDYGNRRVLRFDGASAKVTGAAADGVLGQPDFVTNTAGTTAAKMTRTTGLYVDAAGILWVAERDNNRVLRFDNAAAKANGANADGVLGQPDFTTATSGTSATTMIEPFGVFVDADGRLWVSEDGNSRAIRFDDAANKANGAAADGVLGQPDFTTNTYNTTQNQTGNVRGVWGDAQGRIYLVDEGNSRIVVFNNAASLANGANADNVLGQADFVSSTVPDPPTSSSFAFPNSMFVDNANNQIWVADAGNNRVMRFAVNDLTFIANQPASGVLGQTDLVSRTTGNTSSTMNNAFGVAVDPTTGKLFVADRNNNRVLRFGTAAKLVDGGAAEAVLGQPDDTTITSGVSDVKMTTPVRVFVDATGRLWVSDYGNRRVLRFDNASTIATGAAADGVLGQPDFVTNTAGTTAAKMTRTTGLYVDAGGRLWVAERDNNRVLRFDNAALKANGADADGVLGQPDFVTATSGTSATTMIEPFGVFMDADGRLWVSEDGNSRAIRFDDAANKANGAAADGVLGQPDFATNTYNTTQNQMGNVRGVWGDTQGRLYLVDEGNSRIAIFNNAASLPNGANADNVLGQPDFVTSAILDPPTASSFAYPNSMFIDDASNQIWVADAGNNRVLRFDVEVGAPGAGVENLYAIIDGWNLISVPVTMPDFRTTVLFPSAVSDAFVYSGGYASKDTMRNGAGYWLKFNGSQAVMHTGLPRLYDTVDVQLGWNIIGSITEPVPTSAVTSIPGAITTSQFFEYAGSYLTSDSIMPGRGYWVKVNQAGKLILSSTIFAAAGKNAIMIVPTSELPPSPPREAAGVPAAIPKQYALDQNYPNPFNPTTSLKYSLPVESEVHLVIYNVLGQVVATLADGVEQAGFKTAEWDAGSLASGIYLYRLVATSVADQSRSFTEVRKMMLVK